MKKERKSVCERERETDRQTDRQREGWVTKEEGLSLLEHGMKIHIEDIIYRNNQLFCFSFLLLHHRNHNSGCRRHFPRLDGQRSGQHERVRADVW